MARVIHQYYKDVAWPYVTNVGPTDTRPHFVAGSNVRANLKGQLERRPGFTPYTADTLNGVIERIFTWQRWNGGYYVMLSVRDGATIKVYKLLVGTDATFQLLSAANSTASLPYDFDVSGNKLYFGNGTDMFKYDGTTVTKWGISKPAAAPTATPAAGALSPTVGFKWKYAFGTLTHVGDISDASASTGPQSSKKFTITGSTTADTQVTKVYIFRTTDGGSSYYHHPSSPIAYSGTWSLEDNTADTALTNTEAPMADQNKPPTPSRGVTFFANRLWTFAGDTLYYSNFEEQKMGDEEESFTATNKYRFGREIFALAVVQKSLLVFTATSVYRITGDSLRTFQRAPFVTRFGARGDNNVSQNARTVAWLDTSKTVFFTDGTSTEEVSLAIRPDLEAVGQTTASISFHNVGQIRWLIVQDSVLDKMWVFDQDLGFWNVPWGIGGTAIHSGEIGAGDVRLFVARAGKVLVLDTTLFTDLGVAYTASVTTGLLDIVPATQDGPRDGMWAWGDVQYIGVERNNVELWDVEFALDDDPTVVAFTSIKNNIQEPDHRQQGSTLYENWYYARQPVGRRTSIKLSWANGTTKFILHTLDLACELSDEQGGV